MKGKILFGLFALVVFALFSAINQAEGGVVFATIGGIWTADMQLFRENLSTVVGKRIWWKSKLANLMAFIDYDKFKKTGAYGSVKGSKLPQEAIIHVIRDFKSKKGVKIDIPILNPLTDYGRVGAQPLENHSEARKVFNSKCGINMRRHALLVRDNEMSEQVVNPEIAKALFRKDGDDLKDWFSRLLGAEAWNAIFQGNSINLTNSTNGIGFSMKSHPNLYVQGDGQVAFTTASGAHVARTFDTGYEVNVATALTTLTDVAADRFSAQSIKNMVYLATQNKIQPVKIGGKEYYIIFIHSAQGRQLRQDSEWVGYMKEAGVRGSANPLFTGALEGYPFEGAYVIVDDTIPSGRVTGDTGFLAAAATNGLSTGTCYGGYTSAGVPTFMSTPRDAYSKKGAVLLGQGAIHYAEGKDFMLTTEEKDHKQKIEVGGRMIYGATRPDVIDYDNYLGNGASTFVENASSLVYFTHSTDDITI